MRFAPSPTGHLHVGGARTALFNWLYARRHGGTFIVRVEDTDRARSTAESERAVLRDLRWLGLNWDEGPEAADDAGARRSRHRGEHGPYRQSERAELYGTMASKLMAAGAAYPCFCTEEKLERKRVEAEAQGRPPHYDGTCRDADPNEVKRRLEAGERHAVRFRVPAGARVVIDDAIRGRVAWDADATVGDFIVLRSSGAPVYNFCVAVDDALMGISTVIRAEEHLTNTLRQALVLEALGFGLPRYAHVSLILGEDRQKLSKRHGATSIDLFAREGFLPEAMTNYLALLGWNDGSEKEVYSARDLVSAFELERVTKSPAVFDMDKLRWLNGVHLRSMVPAERLRQVLTPFWCSGGGGGNGDEVERVMAHGASSDVETAMIRRDVDAARADALIAHAAEVVRGSLELAKDCQPLLRDIMAYPLRRTVQSGEADELLAPEADEASGGGGGGGRSAFVTVAEGALASYDAGDMPVGDAPDHETHSAAWKAWVKALGKSLGNRRGKRLFHPLRLALTGRMSGPDVGEIVRLLHLAQGGVAPRAVVLHERMRMLRAYLRAARDGHYADGGSGGGGEDIADRTGQAQQQQRHRR